MNNKIRRLAPNSKFTQYGRHFFSTPSKRFVSFQNEFFRHFIPFLPNINFKSTNIWIGNYISFIF